MSVYVSVCESACVHEFMRAGVFVHVIRCVCVSVEANFYEFVCARVHM